MPSGEAVVVYVAGEHRIRSELHDLGLYGPGVHLGVPAALCEDARRHGGEHRPDGAAVNSLAMLTKGAVLVRRGGVGGAGRRGGVTSSRWRRAAVLYHPPAAAFTMLMSALSANGLRTYADAPLAIRPGKVLIVPASNDDHGSEVEHLRHCLFAAESTRQAEIEQDDVWPARACSRDSRERRSVDLDLLSDRVQRLSEVLA